MNNGKEFLCVKEEETDLIYQIFEVTYRMKLVGGIDYKFDGTDEKQLFTSSRFPDYVQQKTLTSDFPHTTIKQGLNKLGYKVVDNPFKSIKDECK